MTTLVIGGGELEKGRERTRLGAKPASFKMARNFPHIFVRLWLVLVSIGQKTVSANQDRTCVLLGQRPFSEPLI